jgi:hypothetical protein
MRQITTTMRIRYGEEKQIEEYLGAGYLMAFISTPFG